jgi:hypothetical protein
MGDVTKTFADALAEYGGDSYRAGSAYVESPGQHRKLQAARDRSMEEVLKAHASALQAAEQRGRADAAWYLEERAAAHDRRGRVGRSSAALLRREAAKVRALPSTRSEGGGT